MRLYLESRTGEYGSLATEIYLKHGGKMSDTLTVKKNRVIEAAKGCGDVRKALETLFPEAFEVPKPKHNWRARDLFAYCECLYIVEELNGESDAKVRCLLDSAGGVDIHPSLGRPGYNWRLPDSNMKRVTLP